MTKQEEIKEGIADILEVWMDRDLALVTARTIMAKEHYLGVVIRVDRELPDSLMEGQESYDRQTYKEMLEEQAGYVAVKPLIEEKQ